MKKVKNADDVRAMLLKLLRTEGLDYGLANVQMDGRWVLIETQDGDYYEIATYDFGREAAGL